MVKHKYKLLAVSAQPTAHGTGTKDELQSASTCALVVEPLLSSPEGECVLEWGQAKEVSCDDGADELVLSILKRDSGAYNLSVVLGEVKIPLRGGKFGTVEFYHIKTRQKGEVKGLMQFQIDDLSPSLTEKREQKKEKKSSHKKLNVGNVQLEFKSKKSSRIEKEENDPPVDFTNSNSSKGSRIGRAVPFSPIKTVKELSKSPPAFLGMDDYMSPRSPGRGEDRERATSPTPSKGESGGVVGGGGRPGNVKASVWREISSAASCGGSKELTLAELSIKTLPLAEEFPAVLYSTVQLVDLGFNNFSRIPAQLSCFRGLTVLDMCGNQLEVLGEEVVGLEKLEELLLDGNQIRKISPEIGKLTHLRKFAVANNNLGEIPPLRFVW